MSAFKKMFAAAAILIASMSNASANLITNGDFETGTFAGWTTFTTANGTAAHDVKIGPNGTNSAAFHVGALLFDGTEQGGGISQTFWSGAGDVSISLDIFASTEGDDNPLTNVEGGIFQLMLDSLIVDSFAFEFMLGDETRTAELSFSGAISAGLHELTVLVSRPYTTNPWTPNQFVDNVLVDGPAAQPGSQVPEPASLLLLGAGLSALALFRRRKKAPQR